MVDHERLDEDIITILTVFEEEIASKQDVAEAELGLSQDNVDLQGAWAASKNGDLVSLKKIYDCIEFQICSTEVENFEK